MRPNKAWFHDTQNQNLMALFQCSWPCKSVIVSWVILWPGYLQVSPTKMQQLSVAMLRSICEHFDIDVGNIKGRQKAPYLSLLGESLESCDCHYSPCLWLASLLLWLIDPGVPFIYNFEEWFQRYYPNTVLASPKNSPEASFLHFRLSELVTKWP